MKFVVDRSRWYRGLNSTGSALLRIKDGKMCCLGFLALACGASHAQICGLGTPRSTPSVNWPPGFLDGHQTPSLVADIIQTNDQMGLDPDVRESKLIELFAKLGVEVEFVDGDTP